MSGREIARDAIYRRAATSRRSVHSRFPFRFSTYRWAVCVGIRLEKKPSSSNFVVRRTVAALIAVAQGKVTTRDIRFMLEVPSRDSWDPRIKTVPAHGLYLCEVAYSETDRGTFVAAL